MSPDGLWLEPAPVGLVVGQVEIAEVGADEQSFLQRPMAMRAKNGDGRRIEGDGAPAPTSLRLADRLESRSG